MCCGWVFKQNAQGFQNNDKLSLTALKNKPLFKEWLVRIKKANLLKLGQYQICLEHFEKFRVRPLFFVKYKTEGTLINFLEVLEV